MKKLLMFLLLFSLNASAETILLTRKNHVKFRGEMGKKFALNLIIDIQEKREALSPGEKLFIVIESPGGYVFEGVLAAKAISNIPDLRILAVTSASAAAMFLELQPHERLAQPDSVILFHEFMAPICGLINMTQLRAVYDRMFHDFKPLYKQQAHRMGHDTRWLVKKMEQTWTPGAREALSEGAIDKIVNTGCDQDLISKTTKYKVCDSPFSCTTQTWSDCPLLGQPLSEEQ